MDIFWIFIQFFIASVLIVISGAKLATKADVIADITGIGKVWIGLTALGIITSLLLSS